ncbi:SMI1/KNR4 family protein [Bacillus infantis]|uniref:SMI1/KNR4 family protein n=1 Tax=Bacillus infantis TaxID=324767 RepID=UPI003CF4BFE0
MEDDDRKRVERALELWENLVSIDLRNTISYLKENLINVELLKSNNKYSILYSVRMGDGDIGYYEGGIPNVNFDNAALEAKWSKIPRSIKNFYENLHDGFYYYASRAMGLVALEDVTFFEDDEWGIIEELEEPIQINLKTTFGFFKSGMGGYVAIDYKNDENDNATLWFTDDQPKYNVNFWDIVDEWLVIGFE